MGVAGRGPLLNTGPTPVPRRRLRPAFIALGVVALFTAAGCSSGSGAGAGSTTTDTAGDADAPAQLLTATRRSLAGTWKVVEQFDRTTTAGQRLSTEQRRAQRPPDHLVVAGGTVDATNHGRRLACATDAGSVLRCSDAGPAPTFDADVEQSVGALATQVEGANALYTVRRRADGCFLLHLRVPDYVAPPYGSDATLCFDAATGAPVRTEIHRREGTDITVATSVSGDVTDADLAPPPS